MREQQMKFLMRQWEKKFLVVTLEDNIVLILNEKQLEHLEELFERYFLQQQIPAENICIYVSDGDEITSLGSGKLHGSVTASDGTPGNPQDGGTFCETDPGI